MDVICGQPLTVLMTYDDLFRSFLESYTQCENSKTTNGRKSPVVSILEAVNSRNELRIPSLLPSDSFHQTDKMMDAISSSLFPHANKPVNKACGLRKFILSFPN